MCDQECSVRFRLVALDVDGTVLNSRGEVTPELRRTLGRLVERSVHVVLCTGRRWRNSVQVAEELGCAHPVVVCCGGSLIKRADDERTLYADPMDHGLARLAVRLYRDGGLVPFLLYDRSLSGREMRIGECDRGRAEALPYVQANPGCFEWYEGEYPATDERPLVIFTMDAEPRVRAAEEHIGEGVGRRGIVEAMFQRRYGPDQLAVEVHASTATKWRALDWLLRRWGIGPDEVVAIGDDVNDIVMLRCAGLSYAMANATPEVKAVADAVTCGNDEHGVAVALRQVFDL
jgi:hydroxymethylpyrimidine pyrophosphatase-like HAD family hydrolase